MNTIKMYGKILLVLLVCFFSNTKALTAQDSPEVYFVAEYMKTNPGQAAAYEKSEVEQWKILHQARKDAGHIMSWNFMKVLYPSGSNVAYDYYVATGYPFNALAAPFSDAEEVAKATFSDEQIAEMMTSGETRTLVNREVFKLETITREPRGAKPAKYAVVNFMKYPEGGAAAWQKVETEYWKPLHQLRVDAGKMAGWGLYTLAMPSGANAEYDAVTMDFYHNFEDINVSDEELLGFFKKAHPSGNAEKMMEETGASRTMVKTIIIEMVAQTN